MKSIHKFKTSALHILQNDYLYILNMALVLLAPYSRYCFLNRGPSRSKKLPSVNLTITFAFLTFSEMQSSKFGSALGITPRSFLQKHALALANGKFTSQCVLCYKIFSKSRNDNFWGKT